MTQFWKSYGGLFLVTGMLTGFQLGYVLAKAVPSAMANMIAAFTFGICVLTWIQDDARVRHKTPCFDFGLFLTYTSPFSVVGYLIWTRGGRGLLVAFLLLIMALIPSVVAETVAQAQM